jgi:hypothetical protein
MLRRSLIAVAFALLLPGTVGAEGAATTGPQVAFSSASLSSGNSEVALTAAIRCDTTLLFALNVIVVESKVAEGAANYPVASTPRRSNTCGRSTHAIKLTAIQSSTVKQKFVSGEIHVCVLIRSWVTRGKATGPLSLDSFCQTMTIK